jgi:hypothetical protein
MYRIDEFLEYYQNLGKSGNTAGYKKPDGREVWVNAQPLPFYDGILSKDYWRKRKQRKKDAKAVLKGDAIAVTWKSNY